MDERTLQEYALAFVSALVGIAVWNGIRQLRERLGSAQSAAQDVEGDELEEWGEILARLDAVQGRLNQLALRQQQTELEVMDKAEKVARALADRERKRARREEVPDDDHDEAPNHPDQLLARARAAYPLPQLPLGMG